MLSWLNTSTFLALAGITLISSSSVGDRVGLAGGLALICLTVIIAVYSLFRFLRRVLFLKKNIAHADDKWGPPVLIGLFVGVLIFLAVYYSRVAAHTVVDDNNNGSSSLV